MTGLVEFAKRRPFTTAAVLVIVTVYVVEIAQSSPGFWLNGEGELPDIAAWGVLWAPALGDGEWWRLVTAGFLHGGLLHLVLNCFGLLIIGGAAEARFGWWRTALIFLAAVVGGNVAAAAFSSDAPSLGASGGIMGLAGAVVVAVYLSREGFARSQWVIAAIVATLAYGFINPGISNAAHIGGLVTGALVAWPMSLLGKPRRARPARPARSSVNPRQAEFQRRIDEAMRKAAEERAREQR